MRRFPLVLALTFLLVGCGKGPQASNPQPQVSGVDFSHCPYAFEKAGLCASLEWDSGPSAESASAFTVKFWDAKTGTASGPFVEPAAKVSSFIQMQCCGSLFFPTVTKKTDGVYEVTKVRFLPGEWKVFVQLGADAKKEQIHEDVDLTQ